MIVEASSAIRRNGAAACCGPFFLGHSKRRSRRREQRGITIVELVIVAVIATILAITVMIRFQPFDINVATQADRVRNDLRLMQMAAMTWGTPLRFTPAAGGYSFSCPLAVANTPCATGSLDASAARAAGLDAVSFSTEFDAGISFTVLPGSLDYDNQGRPASACDTACALRSTAYAATLTGGGTSAVVTIDPITGFQR